jgi:hypothetical protein
MPLTDHEIHIEISGIFLVIKCACGDEVKKSIGVLKLPDITDASIAHLVEVRKGV